MKKIELVLTVMIVIGALGVCFADKAMKESVYISEKIIKYGNKTEKNF